LLNGKRVARWRNIETVALRKLAMLNPAAVLTDLKIPPNNDLAALKDHRKGQVPIFRIRGHRSDAHPRRDDATARGLHDFRHYTAKVWLDRCHQSSGARRVL
jgi:hypothetical protein